VNSPPIWPLTYTPVHPPPRRVESIDSTVLMYLYVSLTALGEWDLQISLMVRRFAGVIFLRCRPGFPIPPFLHDWIFWNRPRTYIALWFSLFLFWREGEGRLCRHVCIQIVRPLHNGVKLCVNMSVRIQYVSLCTIAASMHSMYVRSWYLISNLWLCQCRWLVFHFVFCLEYNGGIPWSMQDFSSTPSYNNTAVHH